MEQNPLEAIAPGIEIPPAPVEPEREEAAADESKMTPLERVERLKQKHQKEISKHVSREERYLDSLRKATSTVQTLEQRLAQLESRISSNPTSSQKANGSLDEWKTEDLKRQRLDWMLSENPEDRKKAILLEDELERRSRDQFREEITGILGKEKRQSAVQQKSASYLFSAINMLDEEDRSRFLDPNTRGLKRDSREVQVADQLISRFKAELKDLGVETEVPHLQALAILLAERATRSQRSQAKEADLRQREGNLQQSRIQDQVGAKGEAAPDTIDALNAALKARDIDEAIRLVDPDIREWDKRQKAAR